MEEEEFDIVSIPLEILEQYELKPVRQIAAGDNGAAPVKRNTKAQGDLSELAVMKKLASKGFWLSIPFGENQRYDVLADDGERVLRVQVKTGRLRNGVIKYACCSAHYHRGGKDQPYFGQIDLLAVFCPDNDTVYMLPESELVATRAHLRIEPPKNNMRKTIRWARDFELN
jgi:hypothetical protein